MGFGCQSGIEPRDGGLAEKRQSGVEMVAAPPTANSKTEVKKGQQQADQDLKASTNNS